jgi:DNA-binding MarR family transcriptional regulator
MLARHRNTVLESLERIRRVHPSVNMMQALTLLYVAENEGINLAELASVCRTTRATASRSARAMAELRPRRAPAGGTGLLELHPNPDWTHGRLVYLGDAGRRLCAEIEELIGDAYPIAGPPGTADSSESASASRAAAE